MRYKDTMHVFKRMKLLLLLRTWRFKLLLQTHTKLIKQLSTTTEEEGLTTIVLAQTEEEEVTLLVVVGFISKLQLLLATTLALHVRFVAEWSFSVEVLESF